jgi:hypothetical protein
MGNIEDSSLKKLQNSPTALAEIGMVLLCTV